MDLLFGTDCYSDALRVMGNECSHLSSEQKNRLALTLSSCHMRQLGQHSLTCSAEMSLKRCADALDERGYATYLKFLTDIDRCAFAARQHTWLSSRWKHNCVVLCDDPNTLRKGRLITCCCGSMCLFIQSQDFQKHTEHMLNVLYGGSRFATQVTAPACPLKVFVSILQQIYLLPMGWAG